MNTERYTIQSCCGRTSIILKTDRPLDSNILNSLLSLGFKEVKHFTNAGILYIENENFILTGPIGSNRLQIKCKKENCDEKILDIENKMKDI